MLTEKEKMTHCWLIRVHDDDGEDVEHYHCWLPNKYAKVEMIVDIDGMGDGWRVWKCYNELPTAVVLERGQDYKKTRRMSDI